jgi:hypothetical protein
MVYQYRYETIGKYRKPQPKQVNRKSFGRFPERSLVDRSSAGCPDILTKGIVNIEYAAVIGIVLQFPLTLMLSGDQHPVGSFGNYQCSGDDLE